MGYNHGKAVAAFRKRWRKLLRYYRDHGFTYEQILIAYKADKQELNEERRYYEHFTHVEPEMLGAESEETTEQTTYTDVSRVKVPSDALRLKIETLPKDHLRAFHLYRVAGYSEKEISLIIDRPIQTISRWIVQITKILIISVNLGKTMFLNGYFMRRQTSLRVI